MRLKTSFRWAIAALLVFLMELGAPRAWASAPVDKMYALRNIVAAVIDPGKEPIYSEGVENELVRFVRAQSRFSFDDKAFIKMKEYLKADEDQSGGKGVGRERLSYLLTQIEQMHKAGVDAVLLVEMKPGPEDYRLSFWLVNANNSEIMLNTETVVENPTTVDSFAKATRQGVAALIKELPFDGTVLTREGYRVVIDRGTPEFHPMQEIPAFTVERGDDGAVNLVETGLILLTQVDEHLSFGKVIVEKRPREVLAGNKILIPDRVTLRRLGLSEKVTAHPRQFGYVDIHAGASAVSASSNPASGAAGNSASLLYPGVDLSTEIWVTSKWLVNAGFGIGIWTLPANNGVETLNQNTTITNLRALVGYRFPVMDPNLGLKVTVWGGLTREEFQVDSSAGFVFLTTNAYSGFYLGAQADLPFTRRFSLGLNLGTLLFPSFSETPVTSGNVTGSSFWEFAIKSTYILDPSIDIGAKFTFRGMGASFNGTGTRDVSQSSVSQTSTELSFGASYYF